MEGVRQLNSYFEVDIIRDIKTFSDTCRAQMQNKLWDTHIHTRTFAVFGSDGRFKVDEVVVPNIIHSSRIMEEFFPLSEKKYNIVEGTEYSLDSNGVLNQQGDIEIAQQSGLLKRLVGEDFLQEYWRARIGGDEAEINLPLIYINRLNQRLRYCAVPFRVGSKGDYIAVGEDRFDLVNGGHTKFCFLE